MVGLFIGLCLREFLFLYYMGIGKTWIAINIYLARKFLGEAKKPCLVLVENILNAEGFGGEIEIHSDASWCMAYGSGDKVQEVLLKPNHDFIIIPYASFTAALTTKRKKEAVKAKTKTEPNLPLIKKAARNFDFIVYDEIQNCKNKHALTTRIARQFSKAAKFTYGLTGTPSGINPIDFWSDFYIIDGGETLGPTLGLFREAFFKKEKTWGRWDKWVFDKDKLDELHRLIKHRTLTYTDKEVTDIPKRKDIPVLLPMSDAAKEYYEAAEAGLVKAKGRYEELKAAFIRMQQISTGFLSLKTEDGSKIDFDFDKPKIEWTVSFIKGILETTNDKVVVYYNFIHTGKCIRDALKKEKVKFAAIYKDKNIDPVKEIQRFKKQKTERVLVVSSSMGSSSINLQVANRMVFVEYPIKLIKFLQVLKRCHRTGQKKRTYLYFLLSKGTKDKEGLERLLAGDEMITNIVRGAQNGPTKGTRKIRNRVRIKRKQRKTRKR